MNVKCPYCGAFAAKVTGEQVYPRRPDLARQFFWVCWKCSAWVGTHADGTPLGRLADAELRAAKQRAHAAFDPIWKEHIRLASIRPMSRSMARGKGYRWLAEELGLPPAECHIGMFDVAQCRRVVEVCEQFYAVRRGEVA